MTARLGRHMIQLRPLAASVAVRGGLPHVILPCRAGRGADTSTTEHCIVQKVRCAIAHFMNIDTHYPPVFKERATVNLDNSQHHRNPFPIFNLGDLNNFPSTPMHYILNHWFVCPSSYSLPASLFIFARYREWEKAQVVCFLGVHVLQFLGLPFPFFKLIVSHQTPATQY